MDNGVVVITGGSRGIGAASAILAAERGFDVVVNYAGNLAAAEAVCAQIIRAGRKSVAVQGDVSKPGDIERIFNAADALGPLKGLVNNAGVVDVAMRVEDMDLARLERMFAINVYGAMLCAGQAVRRLSRAHGGTGGSIVNLTSGAAKLGGANMYVDYAAAKGAIDSFTVGLALEVAEHGVRVNAVRPGVIETDIHASGGDPDRVARMIEAIPIKRAGTAHEVAEAIVWLLSDASSYTTGSILSVTGGRASLP
ncbi:SDR family oxidoreductase [Devosia sp. 63-57]|uniref:SDR family oxidoreductase n=1 Tax=Devosia sp. 63-57 TaxID=1895751 RepID=UPI00086A0FFC|nr:SDR family oxidoreductase [Devosia sp. 63-57]ODT50827.1 MAG: NAD(P)-dependent oxidoreductase [Pelagibacterium sp. SCN 63-126]ODU82442.1 MAG: NAD(P)-dependent oxidoreductase [Pelagibacterium sp. SCN 63-17]OJX44511.1 MAG: NAD(P)-dependent oxidoreductase [Devosia sp. 63-57]